ncbi:hypothetical protein LCGC14_2695900 [marine sediment metagenome]|uniref:PD(D/E)XK endonuclease domain-containing protein n=1 Tax=marine sediment metagenome TaxID=412755 RepID=A0A0F9C8V9_9ZZZZ
MIMGGMIGNKIGLAGEFRVMSELLLRGHNPAKSYLNSGADIILENGLRIEVKSSHKTSRMPRPSYLFTLKGGARDKRQNLSDCDFVIFWCIDDDCFLIIPTSVVTTTVLGISNPSHGKYAQYNDRWDLLLEQAGES